MADHCDAEIQAVKNKDWATVLSTAKLLEPQALVDFTPCKDGNHEVTSKAEYCMEDYARVAINDPDHTLKLGKAVL